jgi:ubiquinone biosynthesis protein
VLVRRFIVTWRHVAGLLVGALVASADKPREGARARALHRFLAAGLRPFLDRSLRSLPFEVQLRHRLELLGPTYIKLGQILSLREDILPPEITNELKRLLDRLPPVPFDRLMEIVERTLGRPPAAIFASVDPDPLGSASIGQTHRATTRDGEAVILKVIKPGIRETLERDAVLLKLAGRVLQIFLSRYQPKRIVDEFCEYTLREVDLRREADNAETFAANFRDQPDVVFPRVYRAYSGRDVLCMEYLDGVKPSDPRAQALPEADRDRLLDLGALSIVRMLYRDGFFHADLHPGNLFVLPGPKCGFIDLGMVGRFDDELRRTLLYYFYCLVVGDPEGAARYLLAVAQTGPGADPHGFRRDVEDVARRWSRAATFEGFSLGRLILESVSRAARYRLYFPVEMVLMVKALVTFEGVGHMLKPGFDVAAVSRTHVRSVFLDQFSPLRLAREGLRGAPDLVDALVKTPMLLGEGMRLLERTTRQPAENPLAGLRSALLAGACLIGGAIVLVAHGPMAFWVMLFVLAAILALRR